MRKKQTNKQTNSSGPKQLFYFHTLVNSVSRAIWLATFKNSGWHLLFTSERSSGRFARFCIAHLSEQTLINFLRWLITFAVYAKTIINLSVMHDQWIVVDIIHPLTSMNKCIEYTWKDQKIIPCPRFIEIFATCSLKSPDRPDLSYWNKSPYMSTRYATKYTWYI